MKVNTYIVNSADYTGMVFVLYLPTDSCFIRFPSVPDYIPYSLFSMYFPALNSELSLASDIEIIEIDAYLGII